jgi:hypothetical protein
MDLDHLGLPTDHLGLPVDPSDASDPLDIKPGIVVDPTAGKAVLGTVIGALAIIVTGTGTLIGFLSAHKVVALFQWLHQADGLAYLSALGLVGTVGWRVTSRVRTHWRLVLAARAAPNSVAQVKGD